MAQVMSELAYSKVMEISAADLKRALAERRDFERDRYYRDGRARYMAHADGYVMARKPRALPFVISEKEWRQLPFIG